LYVKEHSNQMLDTLPCILIRYGRNFFLKEEPYNEGKPLSLRHCASHFELLSQPPWQQSKTMHGAIRPHWPQTTGDTSSSLHLVNFGPVCFLVLISAKLEGLAVDTPSPSHQQTTLYHNANVHPDNWSCRFQLDSSRMILQLYWHIVAALGALKNREKVYLFGRDERIWIRQHVLWQDSIICLHACCNMSHCYSYLGKSSCLWLADIPGCHQL
jgi:hypothetical protein